MAMSTEGVTSLDVLNDRSRAILRQIVESYLATGEPVGSRNLSRVLPMTLSPASIRNVMSDLEELGLIYAPHTSAGRLPTQSGLRMFVDGLLEIGDLSTEERQRIESQIAGRPQTSFDKVLAEAGNMISGLSHCAGVVLADKQVRRLKQIDLVLLEPTKALVILVSEDQEIENRILTLPPGLPPSALTEAANFINAHIRGLTITEARDQIDKQLNAARAELDALTKKVIRLGLAEWSGTLDNRKSLIVRGQSNLLKDLSAAEDLERIRQLFNDLESKQEVVELLELAEKADGVKIFIGSENKLFSLSGSSLVVAPFHDKSSKVIGILGVIGPTRINYARIIPMVDYTAKIVGKLLSR
ncbi:MAG: heat-inducible transcriptional repressor HrcA [Hyphomicrobiaceae bacterium]|nr:heat-inducible transcriptional repressor HrcA [Hyphomicrobiaceae bacterium]MCC0007136.1 heat-inducible transcriptional repressor HrcA [Hyphomicrobiaceae bacterium]